MTRPMPLPLALLLTATLGIVGACAHAPVVRDRPVLVEVPVAQPCIAESGRPAPVAPRNRQIAPAEWAKRDVRQKAAAVGHQGLARQTYGERLDAATGGCK